MKETGMKMDIKSQLRTMANRYDDTLHGETRARLIGEGLRMARATGAPPVAAGARFLPGLNWGISGGAVRFAFASLLAAVLLAPLAFQRQGQTIGDTESPVSPVSGLEVTLEDGEVVLAWTDGGRPRQVLKTSRREDLADLSGAHLAARSVVGERWVDTDPDQSNITYYIVK